MQHSGESFQHPPTLDALEAIRRDGDPLDGDARIHHAVGWRACNISSGVAAVPVGMMEFGDELAASPLYVAGAGALAVGVYAARRGFSREETANQAELQTQIRDELGEPVDVMRTSKSKREHELMFRWYGAEHENPTNIPLYLPARLRRLAAIAEQKGVEAVAFGASWLGEVLGDDIAVGQETEYGRVVDGRDVSALKNRKAKVEVRDKLADERVLVSTPEQVRNLLKQFEPEYVKHLVALTGSEVIAREYDVYKASGDARGLMQSLRAALETELTDGVPSMRLERDEFGAPTRRIKEHTHASVQHSTVRYTNSWNDPSTGDAKLAVAPSADLLAANNASTVEELAERVLASESEDVDRKAVMSAVYLLLREHEQRKVDISSAVLLRTNNAAQKTAFERMREEPLRTIGKTRGKKPKSSEATIEYKHRLGRLKRVARGVGSVILATSAGAGVAWSLLEPEERLAESGVYDQYIESEAFDKYIEHTLFVDPKNTDESSEIRDKYSFASYLRSEGRSAEGYYIDSLHATRDFNDKVADFMVDQYIQHFGYDAASGLVSGTRMDDMFQTWKDEAVQEVPPSVYTGASDESFVGDVETETNKTVYTVTPLSDRSTAGFWYGATFDYMDVMSHSPSPFDPSVVFMKLHDGLQTTLELPSEPDVIIERFAPDFVVETPYFPQDADAMALLIQQGGEIVGARIVDGGNPDRAVAVPISRLDESGIYELSDVDGVLESAYQAGVRKPVLQYWVKQGEDATVHQTGDVVRSVMNREEAEMIAQGVKTALGLSATARSQEVLDAIKSKDYSYTPLADAGITDKVNVWSATDAGVVMQIGRVLAELESMNCNLASLEYLLGNSGWVENGGRAGMSLATGMHDNGDGHLTQREAHALVLHHDDTVTDPTPIATGPEFDVAPDDVGSTVTGSETRTGVPLAPSAAALLSASCMIVAWRRRQQVQATLDKARAHYAVAGKNADTALRTVEASLYAAPGSTSPSAGGPQPRSKAELRRSVTNNVPTGGVSLKAVQQSLAAKNIDPKPTAGVARAIRRLRRHDPAIRRRY